MKRCVLFDVDKGTEMRQRCGETILDVPHCDDVRLFGNYKRTDIKLKMAQLRCGLRWSEEIVLENTDF